MRRGDLVAEQAYFPLGLARQRRHALAKIRAKMAEIGYHDRAISEALDIDYSLVISTGWQAIAGRYLLDGENPVHALIRLFCLNLPARREALAALFDPEELRLLVALRLLTRADDDTLRAPVALWPLGDLTIATDQTFEPDPVALANPNRVMDVGADSMGLALMVRDAGVESALDLCTGSGGVALLAAQSCQRVTGVDINPRAINFARFNALFNGVGNCTFRVGDLYAPIGRARFDLITANPPYVPTPGTDPVVYRDGGRRGERVLSRVLRGSLDHLTESGVALVVTMLVEHAGQTYQDKLRAWLGASGGASCLLLQGPGQSPYAFALSHHQIEAGDPATLRSLWAWLDHYREQQIERVHPGYILVAKETRDEVAVRRLPIPGFFSPSSDFSHFLTGLRQRLASLDGLAAGERPATLAFDVDKTRVIIDEGPVGGLQLPFPLVECLKSLSSAPITTERLVSALSEAGHDLDGDDREELERVLEYLVLMGYLRV